MNPNKAEVPTTVTAARDFEVQTIAGTPNCALPDADRKGLATLQALWALQGHQLRHLDCAFLLVDPLGRSRELPSMHAAHEALIQIGGAQ
ncbi:MAG TPA: hypothetical protein VGM81_22280 [Burkholderiaceae bacterium]|jgi:hypothetical protein